MKSKVGFLKIPTKLTNLQLGLNLKKKKKRQIKQAKPPPPHPILLSFTATVFFFLNKLKVYSDPA